MFFNWTRWRALKTERVKTKELVAACVLLGVQHSTRAVSLCTTSAEYLVEEFWENLLVAAFMLLNVDNSTRDVSLCETLAEYVVVGLCWQIFLWRLVCYLVLKLAQLPYHYVLRRMNMWFKGFVDNCRGLCSAGRSTQYKSCIIVYDVGRLFGWRDLLTNLLVAPCAFLGVQHRATAVPLRRLIKSSWRVLTK